MASSFVGKVGELVTGRGRDEYKPIQMEEAAESRVSLTAASGRYTDSPDHEASVGLLSHESAEADGESDMEKGEWREKKGLLVCCGVDFSKAAKVLGIVAFLAFIIGAYKLLAWAFYEPPTESTPVNKGGLPEFSTSLGCLNSPYYLNNTKTHTFDAPMHPQRFDHGVDIHGGAVGTIIIHAASHDSPNIRYEVSLRSNDRDFIQRSLIKLPKKDAAGNVFSSETLIATPYLPQENPDICARFDVKMYVPPSLKKLHLASHAPAHIKFDKDAKLKLENLYVTLYGMDQVNMIQSSADVKADKTALEVTRGWIVGDVAVVDGATIRTQRGDGTVRVDVYPEPAKDQKAPETVLFETTTGAGRTKVVYHRNKGVKRPIEARHISARNGPMEFTYKDAGFSGLIGIEANQLKETGLEKLENVVEGEGEQWTHYVGSKDGADRISISSRGWVGLYL